MSYIISGIQQIGVGVRDVEESWKWYRKHFGLDIPIFREAAEAPAMAPYTGGTVQSRDAILAINLRGGGGFEIWQFTSRETGFPKEEPILGDTGIFSAVIKSDSPEKAHLFLKEKALNKPLEGPDGKQTFFVKDPWNNIFQIVSSHEWFQKKGHPTGGSMGVIIGVSNMEKAQELYQKTLGFEQIEYDEEGVFEDFFPLKGGKKPFRRVLLSRKEPPSGPFAPIFGSCRIELVQSLDRQPKKIFENRYWGDAGFIHLCFDIQGMDSLEEKLNTAGFPFTVDSKSVFEMGEASGRFTYIEDPDGTLIEFVETQKIPVVKKWGWYMNLSKRPAGKPLPKLVLKALGLNRVKHT